jgi:hypothetical protein
MNNNLKNNLNTWFITGFADGEASFSVLVTKKSKLKSG